MSMTEDQIIRLVLDLVGKEKATELADALGKVGTQASQSKGGVYELQGAVYELAAGYDRAENEMDEALRTQRLLAAMLRESAAATTQATTAQARFVDAQNAANTSKKAGAQSLIELSRGLQDFQAAGLVGISNNVEGLALAMGKLSGGGAGLAAVLASPAGIVAGLTLLTTALIAGGPTVKAYFDALVNGSNKIPEAADNLRRMEDRLGANAKAIDELREKQTLSNQELAKYNELTAENLRLEREAAAEKARRQADAKIAAIQPDKIAEAASGFQKALGAVGGENAGGILRQALLNVANQSGQNVPLTTIADQADTLLRDASGGDRLARDQILRFLDRGGVGDAANRFAGGIRDNSPEAKVKAELDQAVEQAERRRLDAEEADRKAGAAIADAAEKTEARREADAVGAMTAEAKAARKVRDAQAAEITDNTTIDEQAVQYAAMARARGGDFDPRTGRRTGLDPFVALSNDAAAMARRANPALSGDQARDVGVKIAGNAFSQVDQVIEANRQGLNLSGRNLTAAQTNQQAIRATLQAVQAMGGRVDQVEQAARQLLGLAQDEVRRNAARGPSLLRRRP